MNPFYFGVSEQALYGVLHPSHPKAAREMGVVLCAPTRDEYNPSHRAMRQLASRLARAGFPTLRFDYYGTGDSFGADDEAEIAQWEGDIRTAVTELQDTMAVRQVALVGLRLGGTLAMHVATEMSDIVKVVLWDPVVRGTRYLAELAERQQDLVVNVLRQDATAVRVGDGLFGFPLTDEFRTEVEKIDLTHDPGRRRVDILLITTEERPDYDELAAAAATWDVALERAHIASQRIWEERTLWSNELVPARVLERIVTWLASGTE